MDRGRNDKVMWRPCSDQVDPAELPDRRAARRRFWGVTPRCHRRAAEAKARPARPR